MWVLLFLSAMLIAFFHVKTYKYNRSHKNAIISSQYKDIWPYWILWLLWIIALFLLLFYRWITVPHIIKSFRDKIENIGNSNKEEVIDENIEKNHPIAKEIIVDEETISLLTWNNISYIPITNGFYKIITNDDYIISKNIAVGNYRIPKPNIINYCSNDEKFRNIFWNWVDYNGFIYDYINWKKKDKVIIAILDSWIDINNRTLLWHISKNKREEINGIDNDWDWYIDNINWINAEKGGWNIKDDLWHGTHVAWIILQTFPNAEILPIKLSNKESVSELSLVEWMRYAINHNVDIINLSLSSENESELEHTIIKEATNKWILVIAAAGNEWADSKLYFPGWYEEVISVWAIWNWWKISEFSNLNATTNLPWECIYSYWIDEPWVYMEWTSMSTPHLAWMFWVYKSLGNDIWTWTNIKSIINKSTRKVWPSNVLQISKLLWIEKENNKFYENVANVNNALVEINNKLENLNYDNLSSKDIQWIISYSKWLSTNATNLKKIYDDLWIGSWFWIKLSEEVSEFVNDLNTIDQDNLYLSVEWWNLKESLWVDICKNDYDSICNTFSRIIYWGVKLPVSSNGDYITVSDYQEELKFNIYQWENENVNLNRKLWTITLSWLPKRLKGEAWAKVYFDVDWNWKLSARAVDKDNIYNSTSPITLSIQREQTIITWEKYEEVVRTLRSLLIQSNVIISDINSFYHISPFDYIPESINWELPPATQEYQELIINNEAIEPIKEEKEQKNFDVKENIKVAKVIDWDTIKVVLNWSTQNVRLIWVDSPESNDTRYWYTECYWEEASDYLNKLLKNKYVWLVYDKSQWTYDKYDRLLAYVIYNWENINQKIIEGGYWWEYTYNLPYKYQKEFKEAEKTAKEKWLGLWNTKTCWWKRIAN